MLTIDDIQEVLVIGAGTMGQEIALQCAMHGYPVVLYDIAPASLEQAQARTRYYLDQFQAAGHLTADAAAAIMVNIRMTGDAAAAAAQADLLCEAVPEDPQLKCEILARFHALCPEHTIFTTNTSFLLPSVMAQASGRPGQFAALHFHLHVWDSNVVDIMPHPATDPATMTLLQAFARRIGQIPIVLTRESPGYVFNAMLGALNYAALSMAASNLTSIEDIDRAWMGVMHTPIGPFGILDLVGLDTALDITRHQASQPGAAPALQQHVQLLETYVTRGWLGIKRGRGFYTYPNPAYRQPEFVGGQAHEPHRA